MDNHKQLITEKNLIPMLVFIAIACLSLIMCTKINVEEPIDYCSDKDGPETAFYGSQNLVEIRLKSPSTAKFPSLNESGVSVKKIDTCKYFIVSYVDAQNSFGALMRSKYLATVKVDQNNGDVHLIDIVIQ